MITPELTIKGGGAAFGVLDAAGKQTRFAAKVALNEAIKVGQTAGREQLRARFDRPTRWTVNSWAIRKWATKSDLVGAVGWSDFLQNKQGRGADYWLKQHFEGGRRETKQFERRLRSTGVLPGNQQTAIGSAAERLGMLDAYGNMRGGAITAILSAMQSLSIPGGGYAGNAAGRKQWSKSKKHAARVYWAGRPGTSGPSGIWALDDKNDKILPVLIFTRPGVYSARFDIRTFVNDEIEQAFEDRFEAAYARAMATAR